MALIAGHTFKDGPNGRRCVGLVYDGASGEQRICSRAWLDIKDTVETDIGLMGIAHSAGLNKSEYDEIRVERESEQQRIWEAVSGVCASRGQ